MLGRVIEDGTRALESRALLKTAESTMIGRNSFASLARDVGVGDTAQIRVDRRI